MYAQCNLEGNEYLLLDVLVDYHRDNKAISLPDQQTTVQGRPVIHKTTAGWQIFCQWQDSSTSWEKLSELKDSHPVQRAEFANAQGIDHKSAFNWSVKHVLKKRDRIITSIRNLQTRYLKIGQNFTGMLRGNTNECTRTLWQRGRHPYVCE